MTDSLDCCVNAEADPPRPASSALTLRLFTKAYEHTNSCLALPVQKAKVCEHTNIMSFFAVQKAEGYKHTNIMSFFAHEES